MTFRVSMFVERLMIFRVSMFLEWPMTFRVSMFLEWICILPKNASLLDTRVSASLSHIQTHLILNITIACFFPHPGSVIYTFSA